MNTTFKFFQLISCLLLLSVTATLALTGSKNLYPFQAELMDSLHFPAAILLIFSINLILGKHKPRVISAFLALLFIIALEIIQPAFGRSAQWRDLLHGGLGVMLFMLWPIAKPLSRFALLVPSLAISSQGLLSTTILYAQTSIRLPSIMVKANTFTAHGWQQINESQVQSSINSNNELQLSALLLPEKWQGVVWHNPWIDLNTSRELCFSARANAATTLHIRIDDIQSHDYHSRYNRTVPITKYWQHFCLDIINLNDIQQRALDKKHILSLYFFSKADSDTEQVSWFALGNVMFKQ